MSRWNAGRGQQIAFLLAVSFIISLLWSLDHIATSERYNYAWVPNLRQEAAHPSSELLSRLNLSEDQCQDAFPGLTDGINKLVHLGPFTLKQARDMGPLQARTKNGKVSAEPRRISCEIADPYSIPTLALYHPQRAQGYYVSWSFHSMSPKMRILLI